MKEKTLTQRLAQRLSYTKMRSKRYKYLGLQDELIMQRRNQTAIMEFLLERFTYKK